MTSMTFLEVDALVKEIFDLRDKQEALDKESSALGREISAKEDQVILAMKEAGRKSLSTPFGMLTITQRSRAKNPQTEEEKKLLETFLRAQGDAVFYKIFGPNNNSLTSWVLAERNAWIDSGKDPMEFQIPGVPAIEVREIISHKAPK